MGLLGGPTGSLGAGSSPSSSRATNSAADRVGQRRDPQGSEVVRPEDLRSISTQGSSRHLLVGKAEVVQHRDRGTLAGVALAEGQLHLGQDGLGPALRHEERARGSRPPRRRSPCRPRGGLPRRGVDPEPGPGQVEERERRARTSTSTPGRPAAGRRSLGDEGRARHGVRDVPPWEPLDRGPTTLLDDRRSTPRRSWPAARRGGRRPARSRVAAAGVSAGAQVGQRRPAIRAPRRVRQELGPAGPSPTTTTRADPPAPDEVGRRTCSPRGARRPSARRRVRRLVRLGRSTEEVGGLGGGRTPARRWRRASCRTWG